MDCHVGHTILGASLTFPLLDNLVQRDVGVVAHIVRTHPWAMCGCAVSLRDVAVVEHIVVARAFSCGPVGRHY